MVACRAPGESMDGHEAELLSIGALAEACGISVATIRVWERRYGGLSPVRLQSGHRRYRSSDVKRLRRIAEALSLGCRPSDVVPLDESALGALIAARQAKTHDMGSAQRLRLRQVRAFEGYKIRQSLDQEVKTHGLPYTVMHSVAPLLTAVGHAWASSELHIRHEHHLTEMLSCFLHTSRGAQPVARGAPICLLTSLEGEHHALGLQMAAVFAAEAGWRPEVLGCAAPLSEIRDAAAEVGVRAVGLSISLATGGVESDRKLATLRQILSPDVALVAGGQGARHVRRGPRGLEYIDRLDLFGDRLRQLLA